MHNDSVFQNIATAAIALLLSFLFACSNGTLRMKAPEETEKTMAKALMAKWQKKK